MWYHTPITLMGGIIIRKVELNMNELNKYDIVKTLVDHNGNKQRAALKLGITVRHLNRLIKGYKEQGKEFFIHGNRGRKPANTISDAIRNTIVDLYRTKYFDANFAHFTELLSKFENIFLSESAVASILESADIFSPRMTRSKKKRIKEELKQKQAKASSKKEIQQIQANLVAIEDAHSRRPKCAYFGELQQMDASPHLWFGNTVTSLHIAVDDATGRITGAYFDKEETLDGYYHVFHQILTTYGIPYKFFTDRRTVFTYKQKNAPSTDKDTYTQFAYACKQLGVELESSSVPQAKGRVERMFQTLQSRLPIEMRLAGVNTLSEANEFLTSYLQKFNEKFALPLNNIKSVFEEQPSDEKINLILAVLTERTVDCGHCIRFANKYYRMLDSNGYQIHYTKGTKAMIIQAYNKTLYCCVNDKNVYALEEVPEHEHKSKNLDPDYQKAEPKKLYIPPMNHPWKKASFDAFVKKQKHHQENNLKQSA